MPRTRHADAVWMRWRLSKGRDGNTRATRGGNPWDKRVLLVRDAAALAAGEASPGQQVCDVTHEPRAVLPSVVDVDAGGARHAARSLDTPSAARCCERLPAWRRHLMDATAERRQLRRACMHKTTDPTLACSGLYADPARLRFARGDAMAGSHATGGLG